MTDDSVSADDYVIEDGSDTGIDATRLAGTVGGSIALALIAGYIRVIETLFSMNVRAIETIGGFAERLVEATLGESAALVVESWRIAASEAARAGVFAPWLLVLEALVVVAIVSYVWDRRPYG